MSPLKKWYFFSNPFKYEDYTESFLMGKNDIISDDFSHAKNEITLIILSHRFLIYIFAS